MNKNLILIFTALFTSSCSCSVKDIVKESTLTAFDAIDGISEAVAERGEYTGGAVGKGLSALGIGLTNAVMDTAVQNADSLGYMVSKFTINTLDGLIDGHIASEFESISFENSADNVVKITAFGFNREANIIFAQTSNLSVHNGKEGSITTTCYDADNKETLKKVMKTQNYDNNVYRGVEQLSVADFDTFIKANKRVVTFVEVTK